MWIIKSLLPLFVCALLGAAPAPAPPADKALTAPLLPGEALAVAGTDGQVHLFGAEPSRESAMGGLAMLPWIKLEGMSWASDDLRFACTGKWDGQPCWQPKGHGKLNLATAMMLDCHLAFLGWGRASLHGWLRDYGDGAARARLEDAFEPFLGHRIPPGNGLPAISPDWVGDGELLRTSPEAMLTWLLDPAQDETVRHCKRLLTTFKNYNYAENAWWIKAAYAAEGTEAPVGRAWAVGSNGQITAVLRLPRGGGWADAMRRFREILMVPKGM